MRLFSKHYEYYQDLSFFLIIIIIIIIIVVDNVALKCCIFQFVVLSMFSCSSMYISF